MKINVVGEFNAMFFLVMLKENCRASQIIAIPMILVLLVLQGVKHFEIALRPAHFPCFLVHYAGARVYAILVILPSGELGAFMFRSSVAAHASWQWQYHVNFLIDIDTMTAN